MKYKFSKDAKAYNEINKLKKEGNVEKLLLLLKSEDPVRCFYAANALGEIGPQPGVVKALIDALADRGEQFETGSSKFVRRALEMTGPVGYLLAPPKRMKNPGLAARESAAQALLTIGDAAIPSLIEALRDERPGIRLGALTIISKVAPIMPYVIPAIVELLKDDQLIVRLNAFDFLRNSNWHPSTSDEVKNYLLALYETDKVKIWEEVANFGELSIPFLIRIYTDPPRLDIGSGDKICSALVKIGKPSVSVLIELLKDKEHYRRRWAAEVLGKIGSEAQEAVPVLKEYQQDKNKSVCRAVKKAIKKISK